MGLTQKDGPLFYPLLSHMFLDELNRAPKTSPGPMFVRKGFGLVPIFVPEVVRVGQVSGVVPCFAGFLSEPEQITRHEERRPQLLQHRHVDYTDRIGTILR